MPLAKCEKLGSLYTGVTLSVLPRSSLIRTFKVRICESRLEGPGNGTGTDNTITEVDSLIRTLKVWIVNHRRGPHCIRINSKTFTFSARLVY